MAWNGFQEGAGSGLSLSLAGRTALVTGGSRGIGAATVRLLRQAGARVVFSYNSAAEAADTLAADCGGPSFCRAIQQELACAQQGRALIDSAVAAWGQLDILVVNHGVWPPHDQPIASMPDTQWRSTLGINLDSVFGLVSAAAAHMLKGAAQPATAEKGTTPFSSLIGGDEIQPSDAGAFAGEALYSSGEAPSGTLVRADARELLEEAVYSERKAAEHVFWPDPSSAGRVLAHGTSAGRVHAGVGRGFRAADPGSDDVSFGTTHAARGHIILVASTAAQRGEALHADYAASKGALLSLTKSLSSELGPQGILCNCVAPGWVKTGMSAGTLDDPDTSKKALGLIPLGRAAEPEEIAGPIVFLCTPWAGFISGEIWNVNGGAVLVG